MTDQIHQLIERAAGDLVSAKHALALTGAGMSTESGISDFRGPDGVWTKDPEAEKRAFEAYPRFVADPEAFWVDLLSNPVPFLTQMESAQPNPGHRALAELEHTGILKWTITQNIDGLHEKAGANNVLEYHGSLFKLRCPTCNARYPRDAYDLSAMLDSGTLPPRCKSCSAPIKSDIVFFGEPIPGDVADQSMAEAQKCDVMLVCGTSATVYPFATLPRIAGCRHEKGLAGLHFAEWSRPSATVVEVNAEPTPLTEEGISAYLIQGMTGDILPAIAEAVRRLKS